MKICSLPVEAKNGMQRTGAILTQIVCQQAETYALIGTILEQRYSTLLLY